MLSLSPYFSARAFIAVKSLTVVPHREATLRISVGLPAKDLKSTLEPSILLAEKSMSVDMLTAGHQPVLVWRAATRSCEEIDGDELAIGFMDDHRYGSGRSLEMAPGDALLAYTDGITESRDEAGTNGFLGRDGLKRLFAACLEEGLGAREIALRLADQATGGGGQEVEDDVTLVVARRL